MSTNISSSTKENSSSLSATENAIAGIWMEVLKDTAVVRSTDDFFQLGGDSVGMVTVLFRLHEELSIELPVEAMFSAPTLGELSALVDDILKGAHHPVG